MTREKTHIARAREAPSGLLPVLAAEADAYPWPRTRKVKLLDATAIGDREYPAGTEIEITSEPNGHCTVKALP